MEWCALQHFVSDYNGALVMNHLIYNCCWNILVVNSAVMKSVCHYVGLFVTDLMYSFCHCRIVWFVAVCTAETAVSTLHVNLFAQW